MDISLLLEVSHFKILIKYIIQKCFYKKHSFKIFSNQKTGINDKIFPPNKP